MAETVTVTCSQCGKQYPIPRDRLGRKGKCSCGNVFVVEEPVMDLAAEGARIKAKPAVRSAPTAASAWNQKVPVGGWIVIGIGAAFGLWIGCRGEQAPREPRATITSVRLVPFTTSNGPRTQMVLVDWTNTGNTPIRAIDVDMTLRDAQGNALRDPYSGATVIRDCIYATGDDQPGVPPGTTYRPPDDGWVIIPGPPGMQDDTLRATSATVTIVKVSEKSGLPGRGE